MNRRSKSALFLMEQLIVIAVFAICATACVRILTVSYMTASQTRDMSNALLAAGAAAETYKAASGDIGASADILGGASGVTEGAETLLVYYDDNWLISSRDNAAYVLRLISAPSGEGAVVLMTGELSVSKVTGTVIGEEILSFPVAALEVLYE